MSPFHAPRSRRLRRVTGTLMSVGLALAAGSCRDRSITGASPGGLRRTIDVETSTLQVNVLYAGQPVREAGIGSGCYRIDVDGLAVAWFCGSSWVLEGLAPGDHTLALTTYNPSRGEYVDLSGPVALSLAAGEAATRDLELATRLALVTGRLTINGEPAPSLAYRVCTSVECDGEFGPDGTFSVLAQPGSGAATVTASGTPSVALTTFGYTAAAGETADAGTVATVVSGVDVSLRFAGQPLREAGIGAGCYRLDVDAAPAAWFCGSNGALQGLAPGSHTLSLWTYNPSRGEYADLSGPVAVSLPAGETASQEIDLAGRLGLVTGRLTINGQPAPSLAYRVCTTLECDGEFGADGSFAVLAEPGSGTGRVAAWGNPAVTLAEFGFTAAAGQTTDVGVVEQGTATLGVSLSFAGQPVREAGIGSGCYRIDVDGFAVAWFCGSNWVLEGLAPGSHTLVLLTYNPSRGEYVDLSGPVAVSLAAGESASRELDLATRLALVTGRLTINGHPASSLEYRVCTIMECDGEFGPDGTFSVLAQPGSGTGTITAWGSPSVALATFGFTAAAGQTTVVGTVEGGASGYTPAGEQITVKPVDSTTGTTPVTLKFSAVTSGGNTQVTTGGHGPPPPTGTRPGQPTVYYTIETTAGFTGSVLVCINYDDGWFGNESRLGIYHADASGSWTDVTTSRDPAANVVCGSVSSFSPFLVAERNAAPVVGAITIANPLVPVGAAVGVHATFSDENPRDAHTASVAWDDGGVSPASVTESGGAGTLAASHAYAAQGVYTLTVRVSDDPLTGTRTSAADVPAYVVVYDASGGFVTGGGWIASPAGACRAAACTAATSGRATFGFVARYRPGAWTPSGNAEFEFRAGGLRFSSSRYDWLVPAGARAQFKGSGQINGAGDYGFLITAVDGALLPGGAADRFRIKIWDAATGAVVYDNQMESVEDSDAATELGGGSIVIHR